MGLLLELSKDVWLSGQFGYPVYIATLNENASLKNASLKVPLANLGKALVYMKADAEIPIASTLLTELGFSMVETSVTLCKKMVSDDAESHVDFAGISFADAADRNEVVEIAANEFSLSRFHTDPLVDNEIASRIKAAWAESFFGGSRGTHMVVAKRDSRNVGFALLCASPSNLIIDLLAVKKEYRGKGVGSALIRFAERAFQGCKTIEVATELKNAEAINMYERNDFRTTRKRHVFHLHSQ